MPTAIKFENISKQYRLGLVSTRTLSHDLKRWYSMNILGKEDPYLKIGEVNDRAHKGQSEYVWALKDINFEVEQGDVLGIIGKNGAGKSTLLKILSKVTSPTTGSIKARGRIASLLEVGTGFHPEMTGRENIYMNGAIMGMTKAEINRKLDEIVDFSGVERYLDTPVKRYSSGMTVRLGFAIAAHLDPEILVVDEVLAVGDAEFQKKAIGKMQDVSRGEGRTVLFVSHNMASMRQLCNNGLVLSNGQISFMGEISDSIDNYLANSVEFTSDSSIIDMKMQLSNEIIINKISVNGQLKREVRLVYPNRQLNVEIEGVALNSFRAEVELLLFDKEEKLLCKFAPHLISGNKETISSGEFKICKIFELPNSFCNGEYYLQIDLSNPSIEYLVRFPKSIILKLEEYTGSTGISFDYSENGLLIL